jgi:Cu-processing system ATP-binding protein
MQFVEEIANEIVYLLEGEIYFKGSIGKLLDQTNEINFEHAIAALTTKKP